MRVRRILILIAVMGVSLLLYPALHECGHLLAAWMTGSKVVGRDFFFHPSVSLQWNGSASQMLFIAACGGWFPLCILLVPGAGSVSIFAGKLTLSVMSFFSAAESAVRAVLYVRQHIADSCDAVAMLRLFPDAGETVFLILGVQTAVAAAYLLTVHPLRTTIRLLEDKRKGYKEKTGQNNTIFPKNQRKTAKSIDKLILI